MRKMSCPIKCSPKNHCSRFEPIDWQKNSTAAVYPYVQTGRVVTVSEFYLFYASVLVLVNGIGLSALSIWSIVLKYQYIPVMDSSPNISHFSIPSALLCFPVVCILISIHTNPKSFKYIFLVVTLLILSISLLCISLYIGSAHKLQHSSNIMVRNEFRSKLTKTLKEFQQKWNSLQRNFKCCGVDNYGDWLKLIGHIPQSCCSQSICTQDSAYARGCLSIIINNLALYTKVLNGINYIVLCIQSIALTTVVGIYVFGKPHQEEQ